MQTAELGAYQQILDRIAAACARSGRDTREITVIGVTKGHPGDILSKACALGLTDLGENKVQEAYVKYRFNTEEPPALPVRLHMIGHLQSNKVKRAIQVFNSIDTIDSLPTAEAIDRYSGDSGKRVRVLVQVNTSAEAQKSGVNPDQAEELCGRLSELQNIDFKGFMTMGPLEGTERTIRASFVKLRTLRDQMLQKLKIHELPVLSMGMSGDFEWAIEEGATEIRLGTILWGARQA